MTERITISVSEELAEQINSQLSYGDNRSEWIREAIRLRLDEAENSNKPDVAIESEPAPEMQSDEHQRQGQDGLRERMEAALEEMHVKGRASAVESTRREAIRYGWERLRAEGAMQPRDLGNDIFGQFFDDPNLGYSTASGRFAGYQLWDNCVRAVLRELPGVVAGTTWQFDPDMSDL